VSLFTNMAEAVAVKAKSKSKKHRKVISDCCLRCSHNFFIEFVCIVCCQYVSSICVVIYSCLILIVGVAVGNEKGATVLSDVLWVSQW